MPDRRASADRRSAERRMEAVAVPLNRRAGQERRLGDDRRAHADRRHVVDRRRAEWFGA